jgi:hypothetical protein
LYSLEKKGILLKKKTYILQEKLAQKKKNKFFNNGLDSLFTGYLISGAFFKKKLMKWHFF